jgi:hypothetical protein
MAWIDKALLGFANFFGFVFFCSALLISSKLDFVLSWLHFSRLGFPSVVFGWLCLVSCAWLIFTLVSLAWVGFTWLCLVYLLGLARRALAWPYLAFLSYARFGLSLLSLA